jgi:hypothetical protein
MPADPGTFESLLVQFRKTTVEALVKGSYEDSTFGQHLSGESSLLTRLLASLLSEPKPSERAIASFEEDLSLFDKRIVIEGRAPSDRRTRDATFLLRWQGFHALIQSQLVETATPEYGNWLTKAKGFFDTTWTKAKLDVACPVTSVEVSSGAKSVNESLFSKVDSHLHPWTPGSWMVWDVLSHWSTSTTPVVSETTPVLFAFGGQGQVMRLTVEALPGPRGLVTPDWWRLGLSAFDTKDEAQCLLSSLGRVIHLAGRNSGLRFRWRLTGKMDAWKYPLEGRSLEAAAAVATLAVLEQYEERKRSDATHLQPVLDPHAVVTGVVKTNGPNPCEWVLEPVTDGTLPAKWKAAIESSLDVVCVPASQEIKDIARPENVRALVQVATVNAALEELRSVQRAFANYGKYIRAKFEYHEVPTPAKS